MTGQSPPARPGKHNGADAGRRPHIFLVDGSTYIFRAYHALPPLKRASDGLPVGAVSGFCNMLWKLLGDAQEQEPPATHLAVIFDHGDHTFRNALFPEYKAHRPEAPPDLVPQFQLMREAARAFGLASIEVNGFEADDIIASYCAQAEESGAIVTILSGDKDLMQLVGERVTMLDTMKRRRFAVREVTEKFGVGPHRVIDVQALAGDATDNVPGVPGIGIKTAAQLINEYGDLDTLLRKAGEIKQNKRRENLIRFADQARLSRELVTLRRDVPLDTGMDALQLRPCDGAQLVRFLKAVELTTLTKRVAEALDVDLAEITPAQLTIAGWDMPDRKGRMVAPGQAASDATGTGAGRPMSVHALAEQRRIKARHPIDSRKGEIIAGADDLARWKDAIKAAGQCAILVYKAASSAADISENQSAGLVGIALATTPEKTGYIPLGHMEPADLLSETRRCAGQPDACRILDALAPLLADPSILKISHNIKHVLRAFLPHGINTSAIDDTMLISYVLDAGRSSHQLHELSKKWLAHTLPTEKEVLAASGRAGAGEGFASLPVEAGARHGAESAGIILRLRDVLKPRLATAQLRTVYEMLERPLVPVLARMEVAGIQVDHARLARLSEEFGALIRAGESEIHELAGERFNIASPRQLGDILFGKMKLEGARKTAGGAFSTSATVLEELAAHGHELPRRILRWRQLAKLKSTYSDSLPQFIDRQDGRIRTFFAMAATTTGRLSSSDPNLQNIPVRTREGRKIRQAFVAAPGHRLVSADYSQIELRVLAHLADISALKNAFAEGLDIHAITASEMFGIPPKDMDPMTRRRAKAINFGIIYGISAFGLARQLGMARSQAAEYIETYFARFPGIRDYIEATKQAAHEQKHVTTLFGRRVHFPDIDTRDPNRRAFWERAAINAPIQGSAADIIRRAMIFMEPALKKAGLAAPMLLQVHDELVFEIADDACERAVPVIRAVMQDAPAPAIRFSVPLQVTISSGENWDEAH